MADSNLLLNSTKDPQELLAKILESLPRNLEAHIPGSPDFIAYAKAARQAIEALFSSTEGAAHKIGDFANMILPYENMGAVDSLNLFDLNELIIFSFYWHNRKRYKKAADIGANLGVHSIILDKCGFEVQAFEPDPNHYEILQRNLELNESKAVKAFNTAISTKAGKSDFIRVKGNTTSSHIAGAKSNPYGELETFKVKLQPFKPICAWADLMKIDIEGHEKEILTNTDKNDWHNTSAIVEISTPENAESIFKHFHNLGVNLFSQKTGWQMVTNLEDMPIDYKQGSLFISQQEKMPWD